MRLPQQGLPGPRQTALGRILRRSDAAEIGLDVFFSAIIRPSSGRSAKKDVFHVGFRTLSYQQLDDFEMPVPCGLMKRCGVRMTAERVETIWIFARIQQELHDFCMPVLRSYGQREVALGWIRFL